MILSGFGVLVYAAGWALLPEERDGRIHVQEAIRGRFDVAVVGIGLLVVAAWGTGLGQLSPSLPWGQGVPGTVLSLAGTGLVLGLVWLVLRTSPRSPDAAEPSQAPSSPSPASPGDTLHASSPVPTSAAAPIAPPAASAHFAVPEPAAPEPAALRRAPQVTGLVVAAVTGVCMISAAVLLALHRSGAFSGPLLSTITGSIGVITGIALIGAGVRGFRSPGIGALAIVALVAAGPSLMWDALSEGAHSADVLAFSESTWAPTTLTTASEGIVVAASETTIDLSRLPRTGSGTVEIPIRAAAADLTILVPQGVPVTADIALAGGEASWNLGSDARTESWLAGSTEFTSAEAEAGQLPAFHLDIRGGASSITVDTASTKEPA